MGLSQVLIHPSKMSYLCVKVVHHKRTPSSVDVLNWWKNLADLHPLLAKAVKKYLAIQATSCASGRTFSTSSNTVTCRRTKLDPENVHMIVFCENEIRT